MIYITSKSKFLHKKYIGLSEKFSLSKSRGLSSKFPSTYFFRVITLSKNFIHSSNILVVAVFSAGDGTVYARVHLIFGI